MNRFFPTEEERKCLVTDFAEAKGCCVIKGYCRWWLRSSGECYQYDAAEIHENGKVYEYGNYVNFNDDAVRPVLWVDTSLVKR